MRASSLAVVAALALAGCGGSDGRELPAIALPALTTGDALDVATLRGPAVVNLWATWCVPCTEELPAFQRASEDFPQVRFIGVDETGFGEDAESVGFLADLGVTYEQYTDTDGSLAAELDVSELPATLVVAADGTVTYFHQGEVSYETLSEQLSEF